MSSSELSELSSALSSEDENVVDPLQGGKLDHFFKQASVLPNRTPPPATKKRSASPPHEYVLADNPDIAVSRGLTQFATPRIRVRYLIRVAYASFLGHLHVPLPF